MTLVAELLVEGSVFGAASTDLPGRRVDFEDAHLLDDGGAALFLRFTRPDAGTVEAALRRAEGVVAVRRLDGAAERALFRVTLGPEGRAGTVYDTLVEEDITVLGATETAEGSRLRLRVPTRDALGRLIAEFERRSIPSTLHRLHPEADDDDGRYGLSAKQREALVAAWEAGYYRVPREATLGDIATSLDISEQSVSQRLRRGIHSLVGATLVGPADNIND